MSPGQVDQLVRVLSLMFQDCWFHPQSGYLQESTRKRTNGWNKIQSFSLSLPVSPLSPFNKQKLFLKKVLIVNENHSKSGAELKIPDTFHSIIFLPSLSLCPHKSILFYLPHPDFCFPVFNHSLNFTCSSKSSN